MTSFDRRPDIQEIRALVPELKNHSDSAIAILWGHFCGFYYAAGWLQVEPDAVKEFREWAFRVIEVPT